MTLQANTANDGSAAARGGGLYISRQGSTNVYSGSLSTNSAGRGGGIFVSAGTAVVSINTSVSNNTAAEPLGNGGGVYCDTLI